MSDNEARAPRKGRPAVLLIVIVAVLVAFTAVGVFVWKTVGGGSSQKEIHTKTHERPISRLELTGDSGAIEVVETDADRIVVETTLRWSGDNKPHDTQKMSGKTLQITTAGCRDALISGKCEADFRIEVPAEVELDIGVDSGVIETSGIAGDQRLSTDSGTIEIADSGGKLDLKSDSGTIEGRDLASPEIVADIDSGIIELNFATAPSNVIATGESGPITVELPEDGEAYAVDVNSDSMDASIDVEQDASAKRKVEANSDSGPVTVTYT